MLPIESAGSVARHFKRLVSDIRQNELTGRTRSPTDWHDRAECQQRVLLRCVRFDSLVPMLMLDRQSSCPSCGGTSCTDYRQYNAYSLMRCWTCGFVFTAVRDFETTQYEDVYSGVTAYQMMIQAARDTAAGEKGYRDLWWFKRKALRWIQSRKPGGRLLDVGSGPGTFLMVARQLGYDVDGIEPAVAAATEANGFGIPTFSGTIEQFASEQPFDFITSFEVLEHVADPLSVLSAARGLIRDDGLLVLSVPNLDDPYCLEQQIPPAMPPIHINFFSRSSMSALLNRAGFVIEKTFTLPIPTSSVRNIHGPGGFLARLPYLAATRALGKQDGTTLLLSATPKR